MRAVPANATITPMPTSAIAKAILHRVCFRVNAAATTNPFVASAILGPERLRRLNHHASDWRAMPTYEKESDTGKALAWVTGPHAIA